MNIDNIHISGRCSGVVSVVPHNLASICLERKVVIVIVSVLDLCMCDFFKKVYLNTFHQF